MNSVFVTHKQFNAALMRIVKANIKAHGTSISAGSMSNNCHDLIYENQDDRKGSLVKHNWREALKARFEVPIESAQTVLQKTLLQAVERQKKSSSVITVVRFANEYGGVRYRLYPDTPRGFTAMRDCKVGERVEFLGGVKKTYLGDTQHPIPFWPQKSFEDEYHALPIVQEYETRVFGKPYKEWLAETQS